MTVLALAERHITITAGDLRNWAAEAVCVLFCIAVGWWLLWLGKKRNRTGGDDG